ncbi:MAG: hypothetical protein IJ801_04250 [Lachnospiraceae bacterium]|nr:hypothetical protein [Lachnospiraceae bacterium]
MNWIDLVRMSTRGFWYFAVPSVFFLCMAVFLFHLRKGDIRKLMNVIRFITIAMTGVLSGWIVQGIVSLLQKTPQ